ncbi:MAG TPA: rRNA maturation RNase YbeY [Tepidisphaeraceae bacterium]|jgi:probable rRNA maturation factor|nr:rRNA maturation RNase YbeY [Tepidisphaeraceae bacterium]
MRRRQTPARELQLGIQAMAGKRHVAFLRKNLLAAHAILNPPLVELSLALVGDARMSRLHEQFMNVSGPTDVLTFPLEFDARENVIAGEVIICVPEARRQGRLRKVPMERELLLYALHGMLHLCGFDDTTEAAFRQMHRKENDILIALGFGPVFGDVSPGDARRKAKGKTPPAP